jgi:hypothetical protein
MHQPNSLLPSLHIVENLDRVPVETRSKARDYVAARERKAILDTLLKGHREHAAELHSRWLEDYGKQSIVSAILLKVPRSMLKVFGRCVESMERIRSIAGYVVEQSKSKRVFGSGW